MDYYEKWDLENGLVRVLQVNHVTGIPKNQIKNIEVVSVLAEKKKESNSLNFGKFCQSNFF